MHEKCKGGNADQGLLTDHVTRQVGSDFKGAPEQQASHPSHDRREHHIAVTTKVDWVSTHGPGPGTT